MSKLSFRARALDASKPMPIYYMDDVPEFQDFATINRAVPQMPTGMEKEEECEHHLQRAISAQQAYGHTGELVIPTPEVYNVPKNVKDSLYPATYKSSRQLIHVQPFSMDQDIPDYDMDSEDEKWLSQQAERLDIRPLQYEEMLDRLEKSSGQQVITLKEAKLLLKDDDDIIIAVYDYWLNKRLKTQHPLIPQVKTEKRDGSTNNNPYVAFRRRTEKMQTRKNRKNDEASYEKMLKLRRDLSRAVTLLELVKRREKTKREMLHLTVEILEKRYQSGDFSGQLLAEVSAIKHPRQSFIPVNSSQVVVKQDTRVTKSKPSKCTPTKKRQYKRKKSDGILSKASLSHGLDLNLDDIPSSEDDGLSLSQSDQDEDNDPDGPYAFRRKKNCNYHEPRLEKSGNWPWCSSEEGGTEDSRYRFCLTSIPGTQSRPYCIGFARRRIGRGGRVIFDRTWSPLDEYLPELDDIAVSSCNGPTPKSEVVNEIKNEWKFFCPKSSILLGDSMNSTENKSCPVTKSRFNENSMMDFVKNYLDQEDELFERQRKQLERLKTEDESASSLLLFVSDHSYSALPSSCFNVVPTTPRLPTYYNPVSVELHTDDVAIHASTPTAPMQIVETSSFVSPITDRALHANGPVSETQRTSTCAPTKLEGYLKKIGEPVCKNEVILSSIDLGNTETFHVMHSQTSPLLYSGLDHHGGDGRVKQELFLNKVKASNESVSMDVT